MKRIRLRYYLIILLATLSLTSVGFASWLVSDSATASTNGLILVEDVLKVNDYITCSSGDITSFKFFKTGFVTSDNSISTTGTITVNLSINLDECKKKFSDCNTIEVELDMIQENLAIFNSEGNISFQTKVMNGSAEITSKHTTNDTLSITEFDLENTSGVMTVTIIYTFTIENVEYFKSTVYPHLLQEDFNFIMSAKLTGKEVVS